LVAEVVPAARLERRAMAFAREVAKLPREQAALVKLAVWDGLELPLRDALALERRLFERNKLISARSEKSRPATTGARRRRLASNRP
jgi:enoyl-CoA hydratase/carnithine racemase